MHLLVLNCGSATVKYKLFEESEGEPVEIFSGVVEVNQNHSEAIRKIISSIPAKPDVVAHRVVHGGETYNKPVKITPEVLDVLDSLSDLAPLHNPPSVAGIRAAESLGVVQIAIFDTAFHQAMPEKAFRYALPEEIVEKYKIRRFGFHGSSHQYVTEHFTKITGLEKPTLVTLHLGNGASVCAIKNGRCVDTSMGCTPLEGLVMGTRGGDMDPAIAIRLLKKGMPLEELEQLLWHESGLKGIAGTQDMRELLDRNDPQAKLAIDLFCYRATKYIGAYLAVLEGAQGIIFTGGIGENAPEIREKILSGLTFFGVEIDPEKNRKNAQKLSTEKSKIATFVIRANEELLIATEAIRFLKNV